MATPKNFASSFVGLPGEIRNQIYPLLLIDPRTAREMRHDQYSPRRWIRHLHPAVLRTRRQIYHEAVEYLYACNEFLITISPEMGCLPTFKGTGLPPLSHPRFGLIKRLRMTLRPNDEGLPTANDCRKLQMHLRSLAMDLLAQKVQLEELSVVFRFGAIRILLSNQCFDLLAPLKELRVSGSFQITGLSRDCADNETMLYLRNIESIVRGAGCIALHVPAGEVSKRWEMYRDLTEIVRSFYAATKIAPYPVTEIRDVLPELIATVQLRKAWEALGLGEKLLGRSAEEQLEKIDMRGVLVALEETWKSVPEAEGWGSGDCRDFVEAVVRDSFADSKRELDFWRDFLYMRQDFQEMEVEGTPNVRAWLDVEVVAYAEPEICQWGDVEE